jgi:acetyl-CoA carboxylase alpha subunit
MIVRDELNQNISIQISSTEIITVLQFIKVKKEQEIEQIKNKITKYEQKKRAQEAFYQSLSPVRRFFASRPPSHHQAVEYIVHVKERLNQIDKIKQRIFEVDHVMQHFKEESFKNEIILSSSIIEEIKMYRKTEDL